MADVEGVGAIGDGDFLRWGPFGDMSGIKRHELLFLYPGLVYIFSRSRVY